MGILKQGRTDRKRSWVMIAENGGYTPLPGETTLFQSPQRTTLSLQSSHGLPPSQAYSQQCKSGVVYLTNRRVRNPHSNETLVRSNDYIRSSTSPSPPQRPSNPSPSLSSTSPTRVSQLPGSVQTNGRPSSTPSLAAASPHTTASWTASWSSRTAAPSTSTTLLSA